MREKPISRIDKINERLREQSNHHINESTAETVRHSREESANSRNPSNQIKPRAETHQNAGERNAANDIDNQLKNLLLSRSTQQRQRAPMEKQDDLANVMKLIRPRKKDGDQQSSQRPSIPSTSTKSNLNVFSRSRFDLKSTSMSISESSNTLSDSFNSTESENKPWVPMDFSKDRNVATTSKPQRRTESRPEVNFNSFNDYK